MVSLQYELLNVNANEMIGKTTSYTGSRYRVSHQCPLKCLPKLDAEANDFVQWEQI